MKKIVYLACVAAYGLCVESSFGGGFWTQWQRMGAPAPVAAPVAPVAQQPAPAPVAQPAPVAAAAAAESLVDQLGNLRLDEPSVKAEPQVKVESAEAYFWADSDDEDDGSEIIISSDDEDEKLGVGKVNEGYFSEYGEFRADQLRKVNAFLADKENVNAFLALIKEEKGIAAFLGLGKQENARRYLDALYLESALRGNGTLESEDGKLEFAAKLEQFLSAFMKKQKEASIKTEVVSDEEDADIESLADEMGAMDLGEKATVAPQKPQRWGGMLNPLNWLGL